MIANLTLLDSFLLELQVHIDYDQYREGSYQEVLDWLSSGSADFSISIKENLIQGFH
jgi:hypothetical protein